jgi:hypothetical protein
MFIRSVLAIILAFSAVQSWAADATYVGSYHWRSGDPLHGGFSGLEVSADGKSFTAISDHGSVALGTLGRSSEGVIESVNTGSLTPLKNIKSDALRRFQGDAEGLALRSDGQAYISFEGQHRVWSYPALTGRATALPKHPDFKEFQTNSSLEALAIDADGRLLVLPERSGGETIPFQIYRFDGTHWQTPFTLPRLGSFLPVGMDVGPDGKLYLLERWFRGIGFSSRVRRFDLTETGLKNEETLMKSGLGSHDNLEGISVWHDGENIRLTMISDDNFKVFQVTEFVEYVVEN